jgi:hypothetical protein
MGGMTGSAPVATTTCPAVCHAPSTSTTPVPASRPDGRVRLVKRTDSGDAAAATAQRAIEEVEQAWRAEIGADRYDTMKQAMRELGSAAEPARPAAEPG